MFKQLDPYMNRRHVEMLVVLEARELPRLADFVGQGDGGVRMRL